MKKWIVLVMVCSLVLLIILPSCGGGGDKNDTPTPASTSTGTAVPTGTPAPTTSSSGPVKIGCIMAWSGPMATAGVLADQIIDLVAGQVKNQGGILGGREVKFIKGDDAGSVAGSQSQARRLILEEKVAILTMGGESAPQLTAVADLAEQYKVPYVCLASLYGLEARRYTIALYGHEFTIGAVDSFLKDVVKPKKVAYLGHDGQDSRQNIDGLEGITGLRSRWAAEGVDLVYEQYYPDSTIDFSPYLTKIKYTKPDIVVCVPNDTSQAITINKQISELGGWGDIKYYVTNGSGAASAAIKQPGAVGTYVNVVWLPGSNDPGMKAFEDAYRQKYNRMPSSDYTYHYNDLWIAIKAVELAGTDDPAQVAAAMRSGNLEWDSAWGHLRIGTNGMGDVMPTVAQIQEGSKMIQVWPQ